MDWSRGHTPTTSEKDTREHIPLKVVVVVTVVVVSAVDDVDVVTVVVVTVVDAWRCRVVVVVDGFVQRFMLE